MAQLREIMTMDIRAVSPDLTLRELAEFFVEESVSGAPVVSAGGVVGVVSATDLLEFDAESRAVPAYRSSAEAGPLSHGAAETWTEEEGDPPARYFAELWEGTAADVRTRLDSASPEWDAMEDHTVGEVMTRKVLSLGPDADVREAAGTMLVAGVHRVLVMDGDELVGLVTTTDIMRAVSERGLG